jgi:BlaI family transcriptional regulator, penicillinase repressor
MKLTEAEWQLMKALWRKHPATARQIAELLPEGVQWAYTTIKTMLTRLVEKKAVGEAKQGNISVYEPLLSQQRARKMALKSMLDQAFDGAFGPMVHFLLEDKELTENQRQELIEVLQNHNTNPKGGDK